MALALEENWAGTYAYTAAAIHRPASLETLQELVAATPRLRVLGSRHSFTDLPDSAELVALDGLPPAVEVDVDAGTVSCGGAVRYGELAEVLDAHGLALRNLASLPHICVAGAVATATHGSGERRGNLATSVAALELVTADGELRRVRRGDPDFDGIVVGLGALGAVTRVTLDVEPAVPVRQHVYERLPWDALLGDLDAVMGCGDSVSVFTLWGEDAGALWVKQHGEGGGDPQERFGARAADGERHPIPGLDPVHVTAQRGVPGPWWDRLPHFRMGFTPSAGEEIQSELLLPREHAVAALEAVRGLAGTVGPVLQVSELRTVAADELWMSPQYERPTLAIHFTWKREPGNVRRALAEVERTLAPFEPRPHWGKLFLAEAAELAPRYPRAADFAALAGRLDPRGTFRNAWLERHVLGA